MRDRAGATVREQPGYRDDPSVPDFDDSQPVIIFDGDCVLCSRSMRLIARLDTGGRFRMTPAQGEIGQALYRHLGLPTDRFDTYLLVADGRIAQRSTAVIGIARRLRWPWKLGAALWIVPRPLRDALYNFIARRRYRWFGHQTACVIGQPGLRDRLL
ncbi:MAG: DCC1-like thiol-disulfide oxidoreductase family protein [Parasphingopyxis sp.]|uniref:thiol-disulfide oxidoreductase DCC family protein n=1 Tax=Parasphingopyxis sp. TaxID=1920299 RepID=UPI00260E2319|nr:DCC1-like thiol-disulfide oxidoreductase family protein [uncultured Parasphingopyxis sp.]